jgi:predicted metal-dependent phosphoesterase TrpH
MRSRHILPVGCLLAALTLGTLSDTLPQKPQIFLGGYQVLAVDLHVHTIPFSAGTLAPWDLVFEARRQSLDAIAITAHDEVLPGKIGRWFAKRVGGPLVLVGEEIHAPRYHLIAVGIHSTVDWRLDSAGAIAEVHRQGGIAIAAHPLARSARGFDAAMAVLDGSEVLHPLVYSHPETALQLEQFYLRKRMTAIGSSDYHGLGPMGLCRTYLFVRENSEQGVLEALRAGHTVVSDRGRSYGDPDLIRLAAEDPRLQAGGIGRAHPLLAGFSCVLGVLGLIGAILLGFPR